MDRRSFLRRVRDLTAFSTLGGSIGSLLITPAQANPWVAVALTAVSIISSFIQRPNGLGAMMKALNMKMDLVLSEMGEVLGALANITEAIGKLEKDLPIFLKNAFTDEHVDELYNEADRWLREGIISHDAFAKLEKTDSIKFHMLTTRAENLEDHAARLTNDPRATTPYAAIATPLALGVHLRITQITDASMVGLILDKHIKWHDRILSTNDVDFSVGGQLAKAKIDKNDLLDEMSNSPLAEKSHFVKNEMKSTGLGVEHGCAAYGQNVYSCGDGVPGYFNVAPFTYVWQFVKLEAGNASIVGVELDSFEEENFVPRSRDEILARCSGYYPAKMCGKDGTEVWGRDHAMMQPNILAVKKEMEKFVGTPMQEGFLPRLNRLNRQIVFLEAVVKIVEDTRRQAVAMRKELPA
jgi:hypothetical protein